MQKIKLRENYKIKMYWVDSCLYGSLLMENLRDYVNRFTAHHTYPKRKKDSENV